MMIAKKGEENQLFKAAQGKTSRQDQRVKENNNDNNSNK